MPCAASLCSVRIEHIETIIHIILVEWIILIILFECIILVESYPHTMLHCDNFFMKNL
jgi:hypothetical protein